MDYGRLSLSLSIAGLATLLAASVLIWLLLYEPVALADAVEQGDISFAVQAIGRALLSGVAALLRYL